MNGWHHLLGALGPAVPRLRLRPGVSPAALATAEVTMGIELPPDYREWLQLANGQERGGLALFPHCAWFASLDVVVERWRDEQRTIRETPAQRREPCVIRHSPGEGTCCRLEQGRRIGIAMTEQQEVTCALHLGSATPNQVLATWDDDHFVILGESLSPYFERIARLLERGALVPSPFDSDGSEVLGTPDGGTGLRLVRDEPEP